MRYSVPAMSQKALQFQEAFSDFDEEQINWKPGPEKWSIAEVLDHLHQTNLSYLPVFQAIEKGQYELPWHSRIGFFVRFFGKLVINSVRPDRTKKMKTFPIWEPESSHYAKSILKEFYGSCEKIDSWFSRPGWYEEGQVICSPANRIIIYSLDDLHTILELHAERHFQQALEVKGWMENKEVKVHA